MPIRNPFRRAGGAEVMDDGQRLGADRASQKTPVANGRPVESKDPVEYKLSEIDDSGVYLPPSPTHEKPTFWHTKSNISTTSSNHRSLLSENEPFNISRESFDSYRRSFDISARSPIPEQYDNFPRGSLDARRSMDTRRSLDVRRSRAPPRSSLQEHRSPYGAAAPAEDEEDFEDVGLNDEPKPAPKKGLFSRFGDNSSKSTEEKPSSGHHHFNLSITGRKRGQSGSQGSELKSMPKSPVQRPVADIPVEAR